jgi:hypothetical protein
LSSRTAFGKRNRITQMVTASVAIGRAPSMRRRVRHRNTPIRFAGPELVRPRVRLPARRYSAGQGNSSPEPLVSAESGRPAASGAPLL